jgi:hypothetical protein
LVLTVAKSSSATVATNQLCRCKAQHCKRSYGDCSIATVAASQIVTVVKLSIAPVATNHVAVVKLSMATIPEVATDQVVLVAMPLSQPLQPSQLVNYLGTDLSERKKVEVQSWDRETFWMVNRRVMTPSLQDGGSSG